MKQLLAALILCLAGAALFAGDETPDQNIVVSKGFKGRNAYLIVCKGFPKEGTDGIMRRETAKEAALMNAQFIARDIFNDTVDPVRNGIAKKFTAYGEYVVVHYEIRKKNLRARLRKGANKGGK